jgi:hypothetical protein
MDKLGGLLGMLLIGASTAAWFTHLVVCFTDDRWGIFNCRSNYVSNCNCSWCWCLVWCLVIKNLKLNYL